MTAAVQPRQLIIHWVGKLRVTPRGNRYLECESQEGRVAVWGSGKNMRNINLLRGQALPCDVVMLGVPSGWEGHDFWVPEDTTLYFPAPAL